MMTTCMLKINYKKSKRKQQRLMKNNGIREAYHRLKHLFSTEMMSILVIVFRECVHHSSYITKQANTLIDYYRKAK